MCRILHPDLKISAYQVEPNDAFCNPGEYHLCYTPLAVVQYCVGLPWVFPTSAPIAPLLQLEAGAALLWWSGSVPDGSGQHHGQ